MEQNDELSSKQRKKLNRKQKQDERREQREREQRKKRLLTIAVVVVMLPVLYLVVTVISGNISNNTNSGEVVATGETKEFSLTARTWAFSPSKITVNAGDKVVLTLRSTDVPHGFGLPEFGINAYLAPGRIETVRFVADKPGTFPFVCSVPCGSGHSGMRGMLVVESPEAS